MIENEGLARAAVEYMEEQHARVPNARTLVRLQSAERDLDTLTTVPRNPMPLRSVRVSDAVWKSAQAKADERGENLSEVIRKALERYANKK